MDSVRRGDPVEGHTLRAVDHPLANLRLWTLTLGCLIMEQISAAASSLLKADRALAERVFVGAPRVNELARQIDQRAFEAIAPRQLVAGDLRLARAISRIVVDLECVGAESRKQASIGLRLHTASYAEPLMAAASHLRHMADSAGVMLRNALRGLAEAGLELAAAVVAQVRELDHEFATTLRLLLTRVMEGTPKLGAISDTVFAAKSLERIGDHAKNIAAQVEHYLVGEPPDTGFQPSTSVQRIRHLPVRRSCNRLVILIVYFPRHRCHPKEGIA